DYIESAQVLEDSVSEMLDYLLDKRASHPYFRSVETGYTYSDLYRIYGFLYDYEIPSLYAAILTNAETGDIDVLMSRLTKDCEDMQLYIENRQEWAKSLKKLIDNYSERNKEMMDYHYHSSGSQDIGTEYILKDVEYDRDHNSKETTYDGLIQEYVDLNTGIRQKTIEKEHKEYLLSVFETARGAKGRKTFTPEEIREKIDHCVGLADEYYQYVEKTGRELNGYLSANYLTMLSSIRVQPAVNLKLYVAVAVVLFALVGGVGAVLLGRALDFIDYFRYVDKTVQLPNRAGCDAYIDERAVRLLDENYSCLALKMDSLSSLSSLYGRETGDGVLKDFAMILKSFGDLYGFVGYNGSGVFFAFFQDCSPEKLDVILEAIARQVEKYNKLNPEYTVRYVSGKAVSNADGVFEIRELLRLAMQRMHTGEIAPVSQRASGDSAREDRADTGVRGERP
ncbi:MAG: GGDEF domain-containing protein, partial [Lachnospiraceae bacterium]|nr:GGDEF domain-containing protein [Lachnospiraceae bacterium]